MIPSIINTERLFIRPPLLEDLNDWELLHSDPKVMQYMGGIQNKKTIQEWLDLDILHYKKHEFSMGCIFKKSNNEFIGRAGLTYLDHDASQPEIEIGYVLHKEHWSQGYGTELVKTLIDWGFIYLATPKLVAVTRPKNTRSRQLLEKCGIQYARMTSFRGEAFLLYEIYSS